MRRSLRRPCGLLIGLIVATGACSSTGSTDSVAADVAPLDAIFADLTPTGVSDDRSAVVACMAEAGHEWIDPTALGDGVLAAEAIRRADPAAFRAEFGFGVTTILADDGLPIAAPVLREDPNLTIRAELPDAERAEYDETLLGVRADDGSRSGGCLDRAGDGVDLEGDPEADRFRNLIAAIRTIERATASDRRVRDARDEWRSCMAQAGHPADDTADLEADLRTELADLVDDDGAIDDAGLADLRARELEAAAAADRCDPALDAVVLEVRVDLETPFVDERLTVLQQYRDWLEQTAG